MSNLNISLEALNDEASFLDNSFHFLALESHRNLELVYPVTTGKKLRPSLESQQEQESKGIIAKIGEKVKAFFSWIGSLFTRFKEWLLGRQKKEEEIKKEFDNLFKDLGAGLEKEFAADFSVDDEYVTAMSKMTEELNESTFKSVIADVEKYKNAKDKIIQRYEGDYKNSIGVKLVIANRQQDAKYITDFYAEVTSKVISALDDIVSAGMQRAIPAIDKFEESYRTLIKDKGLDSVSEVATEIINKYNEITSKPLTSDNILSLYEANDFCRKLSEDGTELSTRVMGLREQLEKMFYESMNRSLANNGADSENATLVMKRWVVITKAYGDAFTAIRKITSFTSFPSGIITLLLGDYKSSYMKLVSTYEKYEKEDTPLGKKVTEYLEEQFPQFKKL